jgi:hypothetical protein
VSSQEVDIQDVFSHELAPVPTSMVTEKGMRIAKNKSALKNKLQMEVSGRSSGSVDATVIDGSVHWPEQGTVSDFVDNVKNRIAKYLEYSDVYLFLTDTKTLVQSMLLGVGEKLALVVSTS